jgi:uncharacterized membrane protein YgaE (UPF0421/DUF939 family)
VSEQQQESANSKAGEGSSKRRVTGAQLLLVFQLALLVVLAYVIGERFTSLFHGASASIGALWCALTGITVFHSTRQDTWKEGTRQVFGAFLGAIISGIYLSLFPFSPPGMAISVGVAVLLCQVAGFSDGSKLAAAAVVTIMIISSANPALNPALNAALRFFEACIGAGIAMGLALLTPKPKPVVPRDG